MQINNFCTWHRVQDGNVLRIGKHSFRTFRNKVAEQYEVEWGGGREGKRKESVGERSLLPRDVRFSPRLYGALTGHAAPVYL